MAAYGVSTGRHLFLRVAGAHVAIFFSFFFLAASSRRHLNVHAPGGFAMVHSHRCGVGAIVKFLLTDVSQRGGAAQQGVALSLRDRRESTGVPGPQWNTTKWRG